MISTLGIPSAVADDESGCGAGIGCEGEVSPGVGDVSMMTGL
jgi:hypothetical protein